ncbi:MAG: tRNA (adenosine(37)-N6)-threonylcarbamoyltransferase complex ATPase subunit type 1 TsaE [Ilumatobacteraceae bacterium]
MLQLRSTSVADTHAIAAVIAGVARTGDIVVLAGDMGAGKTAFAQGFGAAMGVTDHMTSPTYNLVHSHPTPGRIVLHHADLYRLSTQHEVADLAFAELAESGGVIIVEWGDVVASSFGDHLLVEIEPVDDADDERLLAVRPIGRSWAGRWDEITRGLGRFSC